MKKIILKNRALIILIILLMFGFFIGFNLGKYTKVAKVKDWSPRISWEEFIREQGYVGHITDIYIKNGILEVGINGKIIHASIIEIEYR